jgi:hypothetical protein
LDIRRDDFYGAKNPKLMANIFKTAISRAEFAKMITGCLTENLKKKSEYDAKLKAADDAKKAEIAEALEMDDPGNRWDDLLI